MVLLLLGNLGNHNFKRFRKEIIPDFSKMKGAGTRWNPFAHFFVRTRILMEEEKIWSEYKKSFQDLGPRLIKIDDQEEKAYLLFRGRNVLK